MGNAKTESSRKINKVWHYKKKQKAKKQNEIQQLITTLEKQLSSVSLHDPQKQSLWTQLETSKQE